VLQTNRTIFCRRRFACVRSLYVIYNVCKLYLHEQNKQKCLQRWRQSQVTRVHLALWCHVIDSQHACTHLHVVSPWVMTSKTWFSTEAHNRNVLHPSLSAFSFSFPTSLYPSPGRLGGGSGSVVNSPAKPGAETCCEQFLAARRYPCMSPPSQIGSGVRVSASFQIFSSWKVRGISPGGYLVDSDFKTF